MPYRALVALTVFTLGLCAVALFLPPEPRPEPGSVAYQSKVWAETHCDRCRRSLTADPQDGLYLIGGQPYRLHRACVAPVVKAARR